VPRAGDLQLLALAVAVGAAAVWVAIWCSARRRVGAFTVIGALLVAWLGDRVLAHGVPRDLIDGTWAYLAGGAVALAAAWGASRLPITPAAGVPPILPVTLASLVGVWAGVPETSAAILAAGVLLGVGAALVLRHGLVSRSAAVVVSVTPAVAATIGAAGEAHALLGGLLCSTTVIALGAGGAIGTVSLRALARGTALHLAAALVAARQVGVARDWDGAFVAIVLVLGLSIAAASMLREDQRRLGP